MNMTAFDQAFALLKVDFTFDPKEVAGEEGEGEESKGFWTTEWDDDDDTHPPENPEGWINLASPYWFPEDGEEKLLGEIIRTAIHESIHEGIQQQPEMEDAFLQAIQASEKGNQDPLTQFNVAHETMANFQNRGEPPYENVKSYWSSHRGESDSEHWKEAQKVKQGEWR